MKGECVQALAAYELLDYNVFYQLEMHRSVQYIEGLVDMIE